MDTSISIQHRREREEALATALGHIVLKFLTVQVNILLATSAVICLFAYHVNVQHMQVAIFATVAWVCHLCILLTIDIAKGGDKL